MAPQKAKTKVMAKTKNQLRRKKKARAHKERTIILDDGRSAIVDMDVKEWIDATDHPLYHGKATPASRFSRARGSLADSLRQVIGAEWDGKLYKIDGHGRARLWEGGDIQSPETVRVTLYRPKTEREFHQLYKSLRAPEAAVSRMDSVLAAFNTHNLDLKSRRLKQGHLYQALALAMNGRIKDGGGDLDVDWAVGALKKELLALDNVNPRPEIYQTGLVAAALIGLALYPKSTDFFQRISDDQGNKVDGFMDPVESVLAIVNTIRLQQTSTIEAVQEDLCARTLRAQAAWIFGDPECFQSRVNNTRKRYWFKRTIQAADTREAVTRMRRKKKLDALTSD